MHQRPGQHWKQAIQAGGEVGGITVNESNKVSTLGATTGGRGSRFPVGALLVTLAVQTLATAAAYSLPAIAPEVARFLGVEPTLIGVFISIVYGVGICSALLSPGMIYRSGAVRVSQVIILATVGMLLIASTGSIAAITVSAVFLGLAYGATAPSSTYLLVPRTPPEHMNVVLSLRQIGVPLGGMLAGLIMPPLALYAGWQAALLYQLVPVLLLLGILEFLRRRWEPNFGGKAPATASLAAMGGLLRASDPLRRLSFAAFVYSGLQICFVVFMTTQLTSVVGFDLVRAGQTLALYQLSAVIARPIWGWLADHVLAARWLLALQGVIMCGAAFLAGNFGPNWSPLMVAGVSVLAGATASGFTGIAYAEYARLGGERRTEATGIGSAFMFAGVMALPLVTSVVLTYNGSYPVAYSAIGLAALLAGILLATQRKA